MDQIWDMRFDFAKERMTNKILKESPPTAGKDMGVCECSESVRVSIVDKKKKSRKKGKMIVMFLFSFLIS